MSRIRIASAYDKSNNHQMKISRRKLNKESQTTKIEFNLDSLGFVPLQEVSLEVKKELRNRYNNLSMKYKYYKSFK